MENSEKTFPKRGKQRAQKDTEGTLPEEDPGAKGSGVSHPRVTAAQTEAQVDPGPKEPPDKQEISQPPGPEIPQKSVKKAQKPTQEQGLGQMQPAVHPKKRRQNPVARGSSYTMEQICPETAT